MINQNINVKKISLSVTVVLIIISVIFYQNQNNSEMKNEVIKKTTQTDIANKSEIKQVSDNKTTVHSNDDTIVSEPELIVEPKEYSVIAEEILYPDEYDFGDILDSKVIAAVGKPIKFNALPIAHAKIGDTIELELDGKVFTADVFKQEQYDMQAEPGDNAIGMMTTSRFDSKLDSNNESTWKNQIRGSVTYDKNGVIRGKIRIQDRGGDYEIYINKQVAYYTLTQEAEAEFARQGYKYD